LAWTSLLLLFLLGALGGGVTFAVSPWLVHWALNVPLELQAETQLGFYLLAVSIPIVTLTSGLRGILEAQQRFRILNVIRIPMSIFSFAGPLLSLPFSHSLVPVIGILTVGRLIGLAAHALACFHTTPGLWRNFAIQRSIVMPVVKFGSWMTVTNIIGPIMVYTDRFLLGGLISISAVAYYSAPFDLVIRLLFIPGAITGVLFPAFAASLMRDRERTSLLVVRGEKYIFLLVFPLILLIVTFAPEGLRLWLGPSFAQNSSSVMRWIAAGVFVNSLAQLPFVLIQSAGRPDITAKVALAEVPFYFAALWFLTKKFGIEGTAIAWTGRISLDAIIYFFFSNRLLPQKPRLLLKLGVAAAGGLVILFLASIPEVFAIKVLILILALVIFALAGWYWALEPGERLFLLRL
jgi:O-antigen/teichoic acid export membrane protein